MPRNYVMRDSLKLYNIFSNSIQKSHNMPRYLATVKKGIYES